MKRLVASIAICVLVITGCAVATPSLGRIVPAAAWTDSILNEPPCAPDSDLRLLAGQGKVVALTFDDGPGPYTGQLLDELAARDAKATFFIFAEKITGDNAFLVRRMAQEGHCVGSHTYHHARLTTLTNSQIWQEMDLADRAIAQAAGSPPQLMRPPFGAYDQRVIDACGKPVILWSLDTRDWELHDPETVCRNILDFVQDGDIILLHELALSSKDGVVAAIDILMEDGYSFVTVPELFQLRGIPLEAGKHYHDARQAGNNCEYSGEESGNVSQG